MSLDFYRQVNKERPIVWTCIDDNGYEGTEQFQQIGAGGPLALTAGLLAAQRMDGRELNPNQSVDKTEFVVETLEHTLGIKACTHLRCTGEEVAGEVPWLIRPDGGDPDEAAVERGKLIYDGDITTSEQEQIFEGFAALSYRDKKEGEVNPMDRVVERRPLKRYQHKALKLEVVYDARLYALTPERYETDPSYGINIGVLELASRALTTILPHKTDNFLKAMSVHTGAVAGVLPGDVQIVPVLERV